MIHSSNLLSTVSISFQFSITQMCNYCEVKDYSMIISYDVSFVPLVAILEHLECRRKDWNNYYSIINKNDLKEIKKSKGKPC